MSVSKSILEFVGRAEKALRVFTDAEASRTLSSGKWSKKELLGHLIDSAANNHQRFVRAQLVPELRLPGYTQNEWVACQGYSTEEWQQLVTLWASLNRHLAHLTARIPASALRTPCWIGDNDVMTLEAILVDYLRHLGHHLEQLAPGISGDQVQEAGR
jgi:hypothetical protein